MKKTSLLRILRVMARFCAVSLGIFMVLLVSAFVLAYFFSGNLIHYYRRQVARSLNVNIDIHKSSLSGMTLTLEGVQIQTRGGVPLARIDKITALLHPYNGFRYGSARWVEDVQLTRPHLLLAYNHEGRLNWDSVTLPRRLAQQPQPNAYRGHIQVDDGSLGLRDQRQGDFRGQLDGIQSELGWEPTQAWIARGQAQGQAIQFDVTSQAGQIQLDARLTELALDDFLSHPRIFNQLRVERTVANGNLQVRLNPKDPTALLLLGKLGLAAQEVALPQIGQRFQNLSAQIDLLGSVLEVKQSKLWWRSLPIQCKGQIRPGVDSAQEPWFKIHLQAGPVALAGLVKTFKSWPKITGQGSLDLLAEGTLQDLSLEGRVSGSNLQAAGAQLRDMQADFELDSNSLHLRQVVAHTPEGEAVRASGWVFRDKQEKLYLKLSGGASQLGRLSPWLAGTEEIEVTALGSLLDPVLTGQARLGSIPHNPLGLHSGHSQFWLDPQSALLWNGQLSGSGGQLSLPWALVDYHTGQIAGQAISQNYQISSPQGRAQVTGSAGFSGDYLTGQFQGLAYLSEGRVEAPGLPVLQDVTGMVGYQQGELLLPHLSFNSAGDPLHVTGSLQAGRGTFFVESPRINAQHWLAAAPGGWRSLNAVADINGSNLDGFRLASRALSRQGGDAYAVGRWLAGRPPEVYAQFADLQVAGQPFSLSGQVATAWDRGRLNYYYSVRPEGKGINDWISGQGWMQGARLQMVDNFLHLPQAAQAPSPQGEGRAYSYFGPNQGPPLQVRSAPPPTWMEGGVLSWNGGLDLSNGRFDDLKVRGRNLNLRQLQSWFGQLEVPGWWQQMGLKVEDVMIDLDGSARGSLRSPQWEATLRSPWTRLSRIQEGRLESAAFSWRADAKSRQGQLELLSLLSPRPQDAQLLTWMGPRSSPPEADWLRSRLNINSNLAWKGWLRAEAFPMATARWLTPPWLSDKLPSGVLSTQKEGLQIGGSLYDPKIAGRVDLRLGRFWTGFDYVPIDEAYVDFAGRRTATALSRFHLKSAGLTLDGRGNRASDGSLTAQLWADDLSLDTLQQFGWDTRGWKGTVDMAFSFRDARGVSPEGWLALEGKDLKPGMDGVFGIRRLVLGSVGRQLDGIAYTGPGKGIGFRLESGEVVVELPPQGAEIVWDTPTPSRAVMEGQVSWRTAMAPNQTLPAWLASADGPRFGRPGQPMKLEIQQFGWALIKQIFALEPDQRQGLVSGSLELLGQYAEQHRLKNPKLSSQPLLTARLNDLLLEGPGATWSGVLMRQPLQLVYSVVPGAAWLRLDPTHLEFFHKVAEAAPQVVQGTLKLEAAFVAMENPGLKKSAHPNQTIKASLQDLPLQNLAFLFPGLSRIGGNIQNLDFSSIGPLNQPKAHLSVSAQKVQVQGLSITAAQGIASLTGENPGRMRLDFGEGADELRFLLGAENDLTQSLRFQGQALLDFDRTILMKSPSLVSSLSGWSLSDRSEFDLKAQLNDGQMRLFSAIVPEQSQLAGSLTGGLQLKGTSGKPELTGTLALENGGYSHPNLSTPLTGLNLLARFERINSSDADPASHLRHVVDNTLGRITVEKLEGNLGGQAFRGKGKAEMAGRLPTFLDFQLDGDELPVQWDGLMDGRANVHLKMTGKAKDSGGLRPFLGGRIEIPQANLSLPDTETLARLLALGGGRRRWFDYDVDVALGNDVWGGYLGSTIRATGDLKITPSAHRPQPAVNGELFLSRGLIRIPVYEVNFRVRQGYAYFEDDYIPRLENLEADSTLGSYQITARFDGKYPNIQAELMANPPLPESDLRRLVGLGGLPPGNGNGATVLSSSSVNPNANAFLVNQGVVILSNMLTGALTQGLGRLLFASEVSFDITPSSEYVIRLAKSLTERDDFLLTFAQVIGTTRFNQTLTQYGIEWRFQPNLLTRVTLDNYGEAKIWFQGVLRF